MCLGAVNEDPGAFCNRGFSCRRAEHGVAFDRSYRECAALSLRIIAVEHNAVSVAGDALQAERNLVEVCQQLAAGFSAGEVFVNRHNHFVVQERRVGFISDGALRECGISNSFDFSEVSALAVFEEGSDLKAADIISSQLERKRDRLLAIAVFQKRIAVFFKRNGNRLSQRNFCCGRRNIANIHLSRDETERAFVLFQKKRSGSFLRFFTCNNAPC